MSDERRSEERDPSAEMPDEVQPSEAQVEDLDVPESEGDAVKGGINFSKQGDKFTAVQKVTPATGGENVLIGL